MKIKSILMAALAVVVFASCSKSDGDGDTSVATGNSAVNITVKQGIPMGVRSEANDIGAAPISMGPGHIFFTDATGNITRHIHILASGATTADQVNVGDFASTVTISSVPNNTTGCYILCTATTTAAIGASEVNSNISTIQALTLSVSDLDDATGGVSNVPIWGTGSVTASGAGLATTVTMNPLAARLQVAKFTGTNDIVSYQVEGIFVNKYFATMPISKTLLASALTDNGQVVTKYVGASTEYPATLPLYDYNATGIGAMTGLVCEPANGASHANPVWAYNVFPNESLNTAATVPQIVVRLKDVVWNDGTANQTLPNPQFITIKGIRSGGTNLTQIQGGRVYTFADVPFERSDISNVPGVTEVAADVDVTLMPWVPVAVTPEL